MNEITNGESKSKLIQEAFRYGVFISSVFLYIPVIVDHGNPVGYKVSKKFGNHFKKGTNLIMFCPTCTVSVFEAVYSCVECEKILCDHCATFAFHCGSIVCYDCENHVCESDRCDTKLLVHMTVKDILEVYGQENVSSIEWERMGDSFLPQDISISVDWVSSPSYTNIFSFPEILEVRVYDCRYVELATVLWSKICLANRPATRFQEYVDRVTKMDFHEFLCWYSYRYNSVYSSFEDRVFLRCKKDLKLLQSLGGRELFLFVDDLKERLTLKNEKLFIEEEYCIPK